MRDDGNNACLGSQSPEALFCGLCTSRSVVLWHLPKVIHETSTSVKPHFATLNLYLSFRLNLVKKRVNEFRSGFLTEKGCGERLGRAICRLGHRSVAC